MDAALDSIISSNPSLLLIPKTSTAASSTPVPATPAPSDLGPEDTVEALSAILSFTAGLLRHSVNKHIYNSIQHLILLLACSADSVASLALEALAMLASPPLLHRQQFPENQQVRMGERQLSKAARALRAREVLICRHHDAAIDLNPLTQH